MSMQLQAVRAFHAQPMFASLTEPETYEVLRICRIYRKSAGAILFRQGEPGAAAFLIESGTVDVIFELEGKKEVIARLGPGDVLGELSLIDPAPRSATAICATDVSLYELPGDEFEKLRAQFHPAAFKLIRHLSKVVCVRLRAVNQRIEARLNGQTGTPFESGGFAAASSVNVGRTPAAGGSSDFARVPTGVRNTTAAHAATGPTPPAAQRIGRPTGQPSQAQPAAADPDGPLGEASGGFLKRVLSRFWTHKEEE